MSLAQVRTEVAWSVERLRSSSSAAVAGLIDEVRVEVTAMLVGSGDPQVSVILAQLGVASDACAACAVATEEAVDLLSRYAETL